MVVDSSALIAFLNGEPGAARLEAALIAAPRVYISAATFAEAGIVAERQNPVSGARNLDHFLKRMSVTVVPVSHAHAELARAAYRRFGKGWHSAALNFGDCFSYALARALGEPLLFVGNDFSQTDIDVAQY